MVCTPCFLFSAQSAVFIWIMDASKIQAVWLCSGEETCYFFFFPNNNNPILYKVEKQNSREIKSISQKFPLCPTRQTNGKRKPQEIYNRPKALCCQCWKHSCLCVISRLDWAKHSVALFRDWVVRSYKVCSLVCMSLTSIHYLLWEVLSLAGLSQWLVTLIGYPQVLALPEREGKKSIFT